jgi:hypothetical protein
VRGHRVAAGRRPSGIGVFASTVAFVAATAGAQDFVNVRYLPGYPLPDRSAESVAVRVERTGTAARAEEDVDRYFLAVAATMSEHRITGDWQHVIPDAPSIEITVELGGRRVRLASAHVPLEQRSTHVVTERGLEALDRRTRDSVLSQQGESFRRHRSAFDKVLGLTQQHVQSRLSP